MVILNRIKCVLLFDIGIYFKPISDKVKCILFSIVYRRWLWNDFLESRDTVLEVIDWRTARTETGFRGNRRIVSPCFTLFGIKFG